MKKLKDSPFANTYGRLSLWIDEDSGEHYLQMGDCFGDDEWGPITEEQLAAFYTLCEVGRT